MPNTDAVKPEMIELKVTVDNHTHLGEPCLKGGTILVSPQTAEMLKAAWAKTEKTDKK